LEQELSELQARYTDAVSARTTVEKQLLSTQTALDELRSTHSQFTELIQDSEGMCVSMCALCVYVRYVSFADFANCEVHSSSLYQLAGYL